MENKKLNMTTAAKELFKAHKIIIPDGTKNPEALMLKSFLSKYLKKEALRELAYSRLNREFDSFKDEWMQAIKESPKSLYGWMAFEFTLRSDIVFYFEGNNDEDIPVEKLKAIINETGNALDILAADAQWATERYTEDLRDSVLCSAYKCH